MALNYEFTSVSVDSIWISPMTRFNMSSFAETFSVVFDIMLKFKQTSKGRFANCRLFVMYTGFNYSCYLISCKFLPLFC